jgi:predicted phage terminase large subunit-like protein
MQFTSRSDANAFYAKIMHQAEDAENVVPVMAELGRKDLFFLLVYLCGRKDVDRDWLFDRCQEVQNAPDGYLDLWSREHYKSTIITYAKTIQDILNDPDITVGIFSHTRPIATAFLRQIKREFEGNELLKQLYPDILYQNPQKESPKWTETDGFIVKRKTNPKEATVEASGLVDGQPTSRHYSLMIYDDVVTRESVYTPEQIKRTTDAWELSQNLGAEGGRVRYIGTRYHFNDTYKVILERGSAIKRQRLATHNGELDGDLAIWDRKTLLDKRRDMGPFTFGCQIMQNPLSDQVQGFKESWLMYWRADNFNGMNVYILVDPASEKKKSSDYTAMIVVGLSRDGNIYIIDIVRDRFNLTERTRKLISLHRKYNSRHHRVLKVGYEKYGMQADIEHLRTVMDEENYRFEVVELGGSMPKQDRIRRLVPDFENRHIYLPDRCMYVDQEKRPHDLTKEFIDEEYLAFPVGIHDDMLDDLARIKEEALEARYPEEEEAGNRSSIATHDYNPFMQPGSRAAETDYNVFA